jgi:hypothetical protein
MDDPSRCRWDLHGNFTLFGFIFLWFLTISQADVDWIILFVDRYLVSCGLVGDFVEC